MGGATAYSGGASAHITKPRENCVENFFDSCGFVFFADQRRRESRSAFSGAVHHYSATGNCDKFIANGLTLNADYHPAVLEGAPPQQFKISAMNIYYNILGLYGLHEFRLDNRNFPRSPEGVFETPNPFTEVNVDWFDYKPAYPANLIVMSERVITPPTGYPTLTMLGKVANPVGNNLENTCVVTFEFTGVESNQ